MNDLEKTLATLKQARQTITDPSNWTRKAYARNKDGETVPSCFRSACAFCSLGAIEKAAAGDRYAYQRSVSALLNALDNMVSVPKWNDSENTTHADVLAKFDEAISNVEASLKGKDRV